MVMWGVKAKEGGVWWRGGTEPENCIACSVISLPPGSDSLTPLLYLTSHSLGSFLPPVAFPRVSVSPLLLSLHAVTSLYSRQCFSTLLAVITTASPLYLPPPLSFILVCWLDSRLLSCVILTARKMHNPTSLKSKSIKQWGEKKADKQWIWLFFSFLFSYVIIT